MPTQRPFFQNFLAAFRAHNALQGKASSATSSSSTTAQAHSSGSPSQPRTITTSTKGATTTALSTLHSSRTHSTSPLSRSPGPSSSGPETTQSPTQGGRYVPGRTARRGSDSSSEGFRDALGKEKWYIGGRTATGEEKYFQLGVVRRQRSVDRLSLDRLSL